MYKLLSSFFVILFLVGCGFPAENGAVIDETHYDLMHTNEDDMSTMEYPSEGVKIKYLAIHCTASREGQDLSLQWFLDFFRNERGWSRAGYARLVTLDGTIENMWPENDLDAYMRYEERTWGVGGKNSYVLSIAYVGGVDKFLREKDTRTEAQKRSLDKLVQHIKCQNPDIIIVGHNYFSNKACPSFDVDKEYGYLNPVLNRTELFDHYFPDSLNQ